MKVSRNLKELAIIHSKNVESSENPIKLSELNYFPCPATKRKPLEQYTINKFYEIIQKEVVEFSR